jgi:hypothetical protein
MTITTTPTTPPTPTRLLPTREEANWMLFRYGLGGEVPPTAVLIIIEEIDTATYDERRHIEVDEPGLVAGWRLAHTKRGRVRLREIAGNGFDR